MTEMYGVLVMAGAGVVFQWRAGAGLTGSGALSGKRLAECGGQGRAVPNIKVIWAVQLAGPAQIMRRICALRRLSRRGRMQILREALILRINPAAARHASLCHHENTMHLCHNSGGAPSPPGDAPRAIAPRRTGRVTERPRPAKRASRTPS
jgi:hypothetical protein